MAGRGSVWSDARLIEAARAFIPAADEVWRLQRGVGREASHFAAMAEAGHYRGEGGTRQGVYVCTPNGRLLGSCNSLDPDVVLAMMTAGLRAWEQASDEDRQPVPGEEFESDPRWEWRYPASGLVLRSAQRDLPPSGRPDDDRVPRSNVDHVWFQRDEARGFLPGVLAVGATRTVDGLLTERLARFHVVDNVRGQTLPFSPREVAGSELTSEIIHVEGDQIELRFAGSICAESDGSWDMGDNIWTPSGSWPRRIETRVLGRAVYSRGTGDFLSFELIALGQRFGSTQFNGRQDDDAGPIGFYFVRATDSPSDRVAPGFIQIYDAPWIEPLATAR